MEVTIDFVARGGDADAWRLVLLEAGPWAEDVQEDLRRIQDRLYGALDAALEGLVAERFPESTGLAIQIELDAYDGPAEAIAEFFNAFTDGVLQIEDYRKLFDGNPFVSGVTFKLNLATTNDA